MTPLLRVTGLSRSPLLDEVSFSVGREEVVCVVGPPGSGTDALVECLAGDMAPDAGHIEVLGTAIGPGRRRPSGMAVVPHGEGLPGRMKVAEALTLFSRLHGTRGLPARLADLLDLEPLLPKRFSVLTEGQRRRVMIALALTGNPEFVLLDKPLTGLKPGSRQRVEQTIAELRAGYGGACVVLDDLAQAERIADRVVLLRHGRVLADGPPSQLIGMFGAALVLRVPPHLRVDHLTDVHVLPCATSTYLYGSRQALEDAIRNLPIGDQIRSIRPPTLMDVYLALSAAHRPAALEPSR